jgi:hypothetical protein
VTAQCTSANDANGGTVSSGSGGEVPASGLQQYGLCGLAELDLDR